MKNFKPEIPNLKYDGKSKLSVFSIRVPKDLLRAIDKYSKKKGLARADLVRIVLDLYVQFEEREKQKRRTGPSREEKMKKCEF